MTFAIGNKATNNTYNANTTATATISVSANSVVLVVIHLTNASTALTVSSCTSSHLTFVKRGGVSHTNNAGNDTARQRGEMWWAFSSGALTNEVITVVASGTVSSGSINVIECQGVNNPSSPWDGNAAVPATNTAGSTATAATVTGVSTNSSSPIVFFFNVGTESLSATFSGWTSINTINNNTGALFFSEQHAWFQSFSSAQSSATYTTTGSAFDWLVIADAFAQTAVAVPVTGSFACVSGL